LWVAGDSYTTYTYSTKSVSVFQIFINIMLLRKKYFIKSTSKLATSIYRFPKGGQQADIRVIYYIWKNTI